MGTRTKIICTIGPAVNTLDKMIALIQAGMNGARLNFSHGTHDDHLKNIKLLKEARQQTRKPLAIILDTKGPEIRLGKVKGDEVSLKGGQEWLLVKEQIEGNEERASIQPPFVLDSLTEGDMVLFDDGYIQSKVVRVGPEGVLVKILNPGKIRSGKGVNIPHSNLNLPAVTEKDIQDILFGSQHDVDIIAASFIRSAEHVLEIKKLLASAKKQEIQVFAKIENSEGVHNFDSIVQVADGIMIARGDLGVEVPLSQVPALQKMMIRKSYLAGKPAITATQMLESMINNPRPTRAEASDVANAIYDSTSAVMLSGETAIGKYPLETVNMMFNIVKEAERDFDYRDFFDRHRSLVYHDIPSAVTLATVKAAYTSNAKAIFVFTSGGSTARLVSRLRPMMPIIAMTHREKCYHQLAIHWGVIPVLDAPCETLTAAFSKITEFAIKEELVNFGDLVVINAGSPFGISGTTNMMILENIGEVLIRGLKGYGKRIHGNIAFILSPETEKPYKARDKIIVVTTLNESYLPFLQESLGIILQNHVDDTASEEFALTIGKELNKSVLVRADDACRILKEEQLVTLDPDKGFIYNRILP